MDYPPLFRYYYLAHTRYRRRERGHIQLILSLNTAPFEIMTTSRHYPSKHGHIAAGASGSETGRWAMLRWGGYFCVQVFLTDAAPRLKNYSIYLESPFVFASSLHDWSSVESTVCLKVSLWGKGGVSHVRSLVDFRCRVPLPQHASNVKPRCALPPSDYTTQLHYCTH